MQGREFLVCRICRTLALDRLTPVTARQVGQ